MSLLSSSKWRRRLLEALIFVVVLAGISLWQKRNLVEGVAPDFSATLLDGEMVSLAALRDEPVLVHFWATWCPICALEAGSIAAIAEDHRVITIAIQSGEAQAVRNHLSESGHSYPTVVDDGRLAAAYGVRAVPASFIVNRRGEIAFSEVGYTSGWGLRLRLWWAGL